MKTILAALLLGALIMIPKVFSEETPTRFVPLTNLISSEKDQIKEVDNCYKRDKLGICIQRKKLKQYRRKCWGTRGKCF